MWQAYEIFDVSWDHESKDQCLADLNILTLGNILFRPLLLRYLKKKKRDSACSPAKKGFKKTKKKDPASASDYIYNIILYFYMFLYKYKDKNQQKDPTAWAEIKSPPEILYYTKMRNRQHFGQAETDGTPFT